MKFRTSNPAVSCVARLFVMLQLLAGFALWPVFAHAQCSLGSGGIQAFNITLPAQVSIPRDAVVGTVLAQGSQTVGFDPSNPNGVTCSDQTTLVYANVIGGLSSNGVFPTPIPGVGYTLAANGSAKNTLTTTLTKSFFTNCGAGNTTCYASLDTPVVVQLVKTGPITGVQTLSAGQLFTATVGGVLSVTVSLANPVQITGQTCSVTNPSISVGLGNVPARTFTSVGSTSNGVPFQIGLDCTGVTTNVGVTFTDVNNPGNTSSALSLTPDSTAAGVGIQILSPASNAVQYGADASVAGNPGQVMLGTISNASSNLTFTGRYVQTATTVHPGSADGVATFTMSYQ